MQPELGRFTHRIIDKFVSLLSISHRLNAEKDFDELLNIITLEAANLVEAERATIFLLDKARGELWARTALGVSETIRFDSRLGIAGAVLLSGKSILVEDAYQSPLFFPSIDSRTGFQTRNVLGVPLRNFRREIIGVFQVLNKKEGKFNSEDEQLVETLALHAAVALENAKAMSDLEQRQQVLIQENASLRNEVEGRYGLNSILGSTKQISDIRSIIERASQASISVLITGENGTGKELSAHAIHQRSPRSGKPFVAVNCAAIPDSLIESELFGIEKGVATGVERRVGRMESANGGTLFLDEIGDLSIAAQAKLLRVLQEREVEWVGGRKPVAIDVRVIAATNKDLELEIREGRFRQDLYFRLNVVHIHLPPLREVLSDIPLLAMSFLRRHSVESGRAIQAFAPEAIEALTAYSWPGNIRQLENEVRRAIVLTVGDQIHLADLSESIRDVRSSLALPATTATNASSKQSLKDRVTELEIEMIRNAMSAAGSDKRRMAQMLGLSPQGLLNKLKRYHLQP